MAAAALPRACHPVDLSDFTQEFSPHRTWHAKGMHVLQSGRSREPTRDFLGHVEVKTTQIDARANLEMKRRALGQVACESPSAALLDWLRSLQSRKVACQWSIALRATRDA